MWSILAPNSKEVKNKRPEDLFKLDDEIIRVSDEDEEEMTVEEMEEFWNRMDADRVRNPRPTQKLF